MTKEKAMSKLIDKDKLVSKIVKRIKFDQEIIDNCKQNNFHPNLQYFYKGRKDGYERILEIIDKISFNDDNVVNFK
jgi:hypothetical protein